jgi:hypothetical protein
MEDWYVGFNMRVTNPTHTFNMYIIQEMPLCCVLPRLQRANDGRFGNNARGSPNSCVYDRMSTNLAQVIKVKVQQSRYRHAGAKGREGIAPTHS